MEALQKMLEEDGITIPTKVSQGFCILISCYI